MRARVVGQGARVRACGEGDHRHGGEIAGEELVGGGRVGGVDSEGVALSCERGLGKE